MFVLCHSSTFVESYRLIFQTISVNFVLADHSQIIYFRYKRTFIRKFQKQSHRPVKSIWMITGYLHNPPLHTCATPHKRMNVNKKAKTYYIWWHYHIFLAPNSWVVPAPLINVWDKKDFPCQCVLRVHIIYTYVYAWNGEKGLPLALLKSWRA